MASGWAWAVVDTATHEIRLIDTEDEVESGPGYERHVVPFVENGEYLSFCAHEFTRRCYCRPRIETNLYDDVIVIHEDRKPN